MLLVLVLSEDAELRTGMRKARRTKGKEQRRPSFLNLDLEVWHTIAAKREQIGLQRDSWVALIL